MKNVRPVNLISLVALLTTAFSFSLQAQSQADYAAFINAGPKDAGKLIAAYSTPAIKAVSYGMTSGWYHTAKAHNKLGIDLGVTISAVFVPTSDNFFKPTTLGLTNTTIDAPSSEMAPTIMGPKTATSYTSSYSPNSVNGMPTNSTYYTFKFAGPEGLDLKKNIGVSAVPVPMIQLGIGTIMNTDLKIRFLPEQTINQTKVKMLGFGLLHDIKQHIPGLKLAPIDISVLAAWNSLNGRTDLSNPAATATSSRPESLDGLSTYDLTSWVAQVLVSKKFSVLTLYAGVGYGSVTTKFREVGTYTIRDEFDGQVTTQLPVNIDFKNSGAKLTAGMRLKFGPIYLNGDYTLQTYNALTIGLGVSVR